MSGMHGDTVVVSLTTNANILPPVLLFPEIKSSGVGEEEPCRKHSGEIETRNDVEFLLGAEASRDAVQGYHSWATRKERQHLQVVLSFETALLLKLETGWLEVLLSFSIW